MVGAVTRYPARHDFTSFGHEITENCGILIVNFYIGVRTKAQNFFREKFLLGLADSLSPLGAVMIVLPSLIDRPVCTFYVKPARRESPENLSEKALVFFGETADFSFSMLIGVRWLGRSDIFIHAFLVTRLPFSRS
jgi:hypothetical protein